MPLTSITIAKLLEIVRSLRVFLIPFYNKFHCDACNMSRIGGAVNMPTLVYSVSFTYRVKSKQVILKKCVCIYED